MSESFDLIVLGGGSAGYAGASTAARLGLKTLVIEGGREVGGLCILRGCMPSKTLLESSRRAEVIRGAAEFGLRAEYHGADGAAILARKRRLVAEFADYRRGQLESGRFGFRRGRASFLDGHTVEIEGAAGEVDWVQGRAFLIATGSALPRFSLPGLEEAGYWTSDEVLESERLPASVVVLGGGAIALELASFYAGIGSEVTLIQRSAHVLKEMDEDVSEAVTAGLERRGVRVYRSTRLLRAERAGRGKRVVFAQEGRELAAEGEEIIMALGRLPNVEGLRLEKAGVQTAVGVVAGPTQQCGAPHLFAAGDVCGPHEVVHLAIQQGELAARNAARVLGMLGGALEEMDYRLNLFAVFSEPEVAAVGLSARECAQSGLDWAQATYPFADHGKSMVRGALDGFVKLIAEKGSGRLLGGACVGPEASELIHEVAVALRLGATAGQLATTPHYHPTLSEIWTYPAEALAES